MHSRDQTSQIDAEYRCAVVEQDSSIGNVKGAVVFVRVRRCRPVACFCGSWLRKAKQIGFSALPRSVTLLERLLESDSGFAGAAIME